MAALPPDLEQATRDHEERCRKACAISDILERELDVLIEAANAGDLDLGESWDDPSVVRNVEELRSVQAGAVDPPVLRRVAGTGAVVRPPSRGR